MPWQFKMAVGFQLEDFRMIICGRFFCSLMILVLDINQGLMICRVVCDAVMADYLQNVNLSNDCSNFCYYKSIIS